MKNIFHRRVCGLLAACLLALTLSGCARPTPTAGSSGSVRVVATIFPLAEWCRALIGEDNPRVELTTLVAGGTDMHSHQASAQDIVGLSTCDILVYVGGESEAWVRKALEQRTNDGMTALDLMQQVLADRTLQEETVEGMQAEDDEEEADDTLDEHVWLSLKNAEVSVMAIADALIAADPAGREGYVARRDAYIARLRQLDEAYADMTAHAKRRTVLFGDRFPFRYLIEDYGLSYYAAFAGCSAETEASFETVIFLARKCDELGLKHVLRIENGASDIADTIVANTRDKDQTVLVMQSMQGLIPEGGTYLSLMEENLETLKTALNE
ncbi:MAG: zinc ABC transporter substrate-binding protein [Clostridia bacterium]|nr:zinc ABC transporter substrate-binding protein [Clostridia bacterium]